MSENKSQQFAKKLLSILGENKWRQEARWVLLIIILVAFIFLIKPELISRKPSIKNFQQQSN
jgi:hypothetical protein